MTTGRVSGGRWPVFEGRGGWHRGGCLLSHWRAVGLTSPATRSHPYRAGTESSDQRNKRAVGIRHGRDGQNGKDVSKIPWQIQYWCRRIANLLKEPWTVETILSQNNFRCYMVNTWRIYIYRSCIYVYGMEYSIVWFVNTFNHLDTHYYDTIHTVLNPFIFINCLFIPVHYKITLAYIYSFLQTTDDRHHI